jgi:hypothetical protein
MREAKEHDEKNDCHNSEQDFHEADSFRHSGFMHFSLNADEFVRHLCLQLKLYVKQSTDEALVRFHRLGHSRQQILKGG